MFADVAHGSRPRERAALLFTIVMISAVTVAVIGIAFSRGGFHSRGLRHVQALCVSTVTDLINVEGSYYSRSVADAQRIPLIKALTRFAWHGVRQRFGEVALDLWMQGTLPVGTIDTGWIDLLLTLGGLGVLCLGALFVQIILTNRQLLKSADVKNFEDRSWMLANIGYIVLITVSSVAAALPSWEPGIATVAIIITQTMRFELEAAAPATDNAAQPARAPAKIAVPVS